MITTGTSAASSEAVSTAQGNPERGGRVAGENEEMCGVLFYVGREGSERTN